MSTQQFILAIAFVSILIIMALYLVEAYSRWAMEKRFRANRARRAAAVTAEEQPVDGSDGGKSGSAETLPLPAGLDRDGIRRQGIYDGDEDQRTDQ